MLLDNATSTGEKVHPKVTAFGIQSEKQPIQQKHRKNAQQLKQVRDLQRKNLHAKQ